MKERQLLELLGEADDRHVLAADRPTPKKRTARRRWAALAACLCLAAGLGVWGWQTTAPANNSGETPNLPQPQEEPVPVEELLAPSAGYENQILHVSMLPLLGRIAEYHQVTDAGPERLEKAVGEPLDGVEGWYRLLGHAEPRYLLTRGEDGSLSLWEFACFQVWDQETQAQLQEAMATGDSLWSQVPWFSWDLDVSPYSYGTVLADVYGIDSADDILSITVDPANMDNTDAGKALQQEIGSRIVTDRADIAALYQALSAMVCLGGDHWEEIGLDDDLLEAVRQGRYLTLHTEGGAIATLKYTASAGQFYEYGGVAYEPLAAETAEEISRILGVGSRSAES